MKALVTGASSGIGREIALMLGRRGYHLILVARSREALEELAQQLPYGATVIAMDLSEPGAAVALKERCLHLEHEIDVLVNNAGFGKMERHHLIAPETVASMGHLNMITLAELCSLFGADMVRRRRGHILNVASVAAYFPLPFFAHYAATKAYVMSLSLALWQEYKAHNVQVTCVNPGPTATNFAATARPSEKEKLFAKSMDAERVAAIAVDDMFAGKRLSVPGRRNRLLAFLANLAPTSMVLAAAQRNLKSRVSE